MLTDTGRHMVAMAILDQFREVELFVEGEEQREVVGLDEGYPLINDEMTQVIFQATFGSDQGNFNWETRGITMGPSDDASSDIDREQSDAGRKVPGAVWTLRIVHDVVADPSAA